MSDSVADLILPILQSIQAQLAEFRVKFDEIDARFEQIDRRFDQMDGRFDAMEGRMNAFSELTVARFTIIENALVDLSARTHVLSSRVDKRGA